MTNAAGQVPAIDFVQDAVVVVHGFDSLGHLLGFAQSNHALFGRQGQAGAVAADAPLGTHCVALSAGNYEASQLVQEVERVMNCTYFEIEDSASSHRLSIMNDIGVVVAVVVPPGMYTPQTLAVTLTELLARAWPAGELEVTYDSCEYLYAFDSRVEKVFSLLFDDPTLTTVADQLGFQPFRYGSDTYYEATDQRGCLGGFSSRCSAADPMIRFPNTILQMIDEQKASRFNLYFCGPPPLPVVTTTIAVEWPDGILIRVSNPTQAHGFQVNDIARMRVMGEVFDLVVADVVSGTEFLASLGSITLPVMDLALTGYMISHVRDFQVIRIDLVAIPYGVGEWIFLLCDGETYVCKITEVTSGYVELDLTPETIPSACLGVVGQQPGLSIRGTVQIEHVGVPSVSLLMGLGNPCQIKPMLLGFGPVDMLWNGPGCIRAPFVYRLQTSEYILLEMTYPAQGSARIEHRAGDDNRTTILGKIITLTDPHLDRFYPMMATFYAGTRLEYFEFRLLNPDHSLYQLHGHDWQATFRLHASEQLLRL